MQFLRSTTPFAQIQKAALWKSFKLKPFLRQYLLTNIYMTASRSKEYQEDLVKKDMDQLALRNQHAQGFYWRPLIDLDLAKKYESFLVKDMTPEQKKDFNKAVKSLQEYEQLYQFMALGSQIHTTFQMIYRTMNQNFPVPAKAWRYSPEYDMDKKIFEAEALFNLFFNMRDAAKDSNEWLKKIDLDLGKHLNFLYGLFPRAIIEKYASDLPYMVKFDYEKGRFFR